MATKSFPVLLFIILIVSSNSKATPPKTTNIEFFFHDQVSGKHPTAVPIVRSNISSITLFGNLVMIDDLLTKTQYPNSTVVGRAQGMYGGADLNIPAFLMVMNFLFTNPKSKHCGSTLAMLGRNAVLSPVREMPIVGGTGVFRHARGFAQASTVWFNEKGDAIVHYNITVLHY